jgi:lipopolysaccharide/colanic/teichoic acid biosynthesis glycosyltransferase
VVVGRTDLLGSVEPTAPPRRGHAFEHPFGRRARAVKRGLDIVLATVGLVLSLPVLLAAMVAVRCESRGPMLFRQVRVGANGRRFCLLKIRTMYDRAPDQSHREYVAALMHGRAPLHRGMYKLADDPRITKVGRLLRRFSLDELPQFLNVLKGDMSLVGPRPPLVGEVDLYSDEAWARLRVKPGMTGLWQVSGRSRLSFAEMITLDVRYWQQWSLRLDVTILLKTPRVVLSGSGAA